MSIVVGIIIGGIIICIILYWQKRKQSKDIIVNISANELKSLVNDTRDFDKQPGYHFHACLKRPNDRIREGKIYLKHDGRIMGYGLVADIIKIDDEQQTLVTGQLWRLKNKTIVTWLKSEWYTEPIEYNNNITVLTYKYFNLEKLLGDRREPELINMEEVCKKKQADLSIVKEEKKLS